MDESATAFFIGKSALSNLDGWKLLGEDVPQFRQGFIGDVTAVRCDSLNFPKE